MADVKGAVHAVREIADIFGDLGGIAHLFQVITGKEPPAALTETSSAKKRDADEVANADLIEKVYKADSMLGEALIRFNVWDRIRIKRLYEKLGRPAANYLGMYRRNRMRQMITGMPKSSPEKYGTSATTSSSGGSVRGSRRHSTKTTRELRTSGSSAGFDFYVRFGTAIVEEYTKQVRSGKYKREETCWEKGFEKGLDFLDAHDISRVPTPDEVPNLVAFVGWLKKNGGDAGNKAIKKVSKVSEFALKSSTELTQAVADAEAELDRKNARNPLRRAFSWFMT